MKKRIYALMVLALLVLTTQAQDNTTWWGNYTGNESTSLTGNYQLGTYEAAMFVAGDADLKGISIEAFRAQTRLYSNAKNFKFWIRTSLDGENVAEATPETLSGSSASMTTATLDTPFTLPETGAYIGYSFELSSWYSDYDYTPVVYAQKVVEKGFYLKQPGETEFTDKSSMGCLAAQIGFKAPAAEMWWGNYTGSEQTGLLGNNKVPGNYQAAMFVPGDGALKGTEIKSIRIQTRLSASSSQNVKFWVRSALDGENLAEVTPETVAGSGFTTVDLPQPFALPETGAYVGYSFSVTTWWNEYEGTPVVYAKKSVEGGLYLMQPEETEFTDKSSTGCLAAQVLVSGDGLNANAAQVADDLDDIVALVGQPITLAITLTNQGSAGVESIDYSYTLDGAQQEGHLDLPAPIEAMLGAKQTVSVELAAPQQAGKQDVELQITKVNGQANGITGKKAKLSVGVTVLSESAPRKAVAEIFYNTGNGYAPRAFVGQQQLSSSLGADVIAFLVDHYNGALAVPSYAEFQKNYTGESFTNKYGSYPVAEVNRSFTIDPYTGTVAASNYGENHFAADLAVSPTLSAPTEASVDLSADWTDATQTKVALTATTKFKADFKSAPYRLAFVVVKDHVKETIYNYITYYKSAYTDDDMAEWRSNPYENANYELNNVAVAASEVTGITGSVPSTLKAGEEYTYEYELEVPVAEGQEAADNARAIVLLVNRYTKEIVNANIIAVGGGSTVGIERMPTVGQPLGSDAVYNLNGQRVASPRQGLYIKNGKKVLVP
ncbi:MAG: hypothetical protein IJ570_08115 [Prevotella sp.]|nr:hypothetical protein [Prevotella sp.]